MLRCRKSGAASARFFCVSNSCSRKRRVCPAPCELTHASSPHSFPMAGFSAAARRDNPPFMHVAESLGCGDNVLFAYEFLQTCVETTMSNMFLGATAAKYQSSALCHCFSRAVTSPSPARSRCIRTSSGTSTRTRTSMRSRSSGRAV